MVKYLLFTAFSLFLLTIASGQSPVKVGEMRTVTGKVISSEDKQGIPGVNVVILNSTKGTSTDELGNYSIEVSPNDNILAFSFIGFTTQTQEIGNRDVIEVEMQVSEIALQEVMVVGYGVQRKSDITGSTASVKGSELSKQPVLTATQALQGKVAGIQIISSGQPGTSPQIRLRGVSTALAGTTSLYVVDGVLTDDITNINTADIVDINILKDASSAAIYGSRGANGVIIITTKKGVAGDFKLSYNNNIGIRQAANLVEMANAAEYSNYTQASTGAAPDPTPYDTDWFDTILRTAVQQSHNISLSGGNDRATFLVNVGYLNDEGIVIDNNFKRLTVRLNQDYKISNKVNFGIQSSYGNSINQNGFGNIDIDAYGNIGSAYNNAYRAAPIIANIDSGRYGNTSLYQNVGNPLLSLKSNSVRVKENRLQGSSYLDYKPVEWITLRTSIGADWKNSLNRVYYYKIVADENTFLTAGGNQEAPLSALNIKQTQTFRWVWDNTATFHKKFGNHDITLLVGTTAEKYNQQWFAANRSDVPANPNLWYIDVGDANSSQNSGKGDSWARNSYLARLNYAYNDKYLFTATVRRDGSSRLPLKNRWQTYPSFGLGWIITREDFFQNQNIFDLLKLRASYGKVGNDQIATDAFTQTVALNKPYAFNGSVAAATNGAQINQIVDPNITWEITEEYDLAVEFGVLQSKLTGEINYYTKKVNNALINIPILSSVGDIDAQVLTNAASIENKGVEIALNWKDNITENLSYTISGNVTLNKNNVVDLNGGQAILGGSIGAEQGFTTYTTNGRPVGGFYVLRTIGIFNSVAEINAYQNSEGTVIQPDAKAGHFKYKDVNDDGKINDLDRVFVGSYQPVAYFGINLGVNYKNWDLSVSLYGNVGNEVYNGKRAVRVNDRDNVEKDVVYKRWTSANHTQSNPGANAGASQLASDYYLESGSFLRINNVTLGYAFKKELLQRIKISTLRVYATSQNLLTFKKYSGFTAELPGDPINSGIELSAYPTTRTIAVGLNVGF